MQMEKQQKMKNGKGAGIRLKINACILATLVVLVALMAVVIGRASQYNAQYSQILDSISKVTDTPASQHFPLSLFNGQALCPRSFS